MSAQEQLFAATSSATTSRCERYRYTLTRAWGAGPRALFVMLNPSTADRFVDDATIRKCVGFARRWGCGGIEVVNLWAIRSTDPAGVLAVDDPIGPDNDAAIRAALDRCAIVVCAWGAHATGMLKRVGPARVAQVLAILRERRCDGHSPAECEESCPRVVPMCLGVSADGSPRHPLMLPYSTSLEAFGG